MLASAFFRGDAGEHDGFSRDLDHHSAAGAVVGGRVRSQAIAGKRLAAIQTEGDMEGKWCKNFFLAFAISAFVSAPAWAIDHHHDLNGTWMLMLPAGGSGGESATAAGTVTIDDRAGNIYVVQNLTYGDSSGEASAAFTLEGRKGATIREGNLTGKANWKNGVLEVETTQNGVTNVERFSLQPDGAMLLDFERPGRPSVTLLFERE